MENNYKVTTGPTDTDRTIGEARNAILDGLKARRATNDWDNKFIYYVPQGNYKSVTDVAKNSFGEFTPYGEYIAMKLPDGRVIPWCPTQEDILKDDWIIF